MWKEFAKIAAVAFVCIWAANNFGPVKNIVGPK